MRQILMFNFHLVKRYCSRKLVQIRMINFIVLFTCLFIFFFSYMSFIKHYMLKKNKKRELLCVPLHVIIITCPCIRMKWWYFQRWWDSSAESFCPVENFWSLLVLYPCLISKHLQYGKLKQNGCYHLLLLQIFEVLKFIKVIAIVSFT